MFGITKQDLAPIYRLTSILDPKSNTEKLGGWGILYICSGAMAAGNRSWIEKVKSSDTFVCETDYANFLTGKEVCTSDDYAIKFSEYIKDWNNTELAKRTIEQRMASHKDRISPSAYECNVKWAILAYMLNSLENISREELFGFDCGKWVNVSTFQEQIFGWPELFFATGLLLVSEPSFGWDSMASAIHGMYRPYRNEIEELFEHYAGRNPFSKSTDNRVRTDKLSKGTRIRLRNGWEGIVVEECDGNTLIAKIFGDSTETGSIYAHNIVAAEINGKWVMVEMTEEQARFYHETKQFLG